MVIKTCRDVQKAAKNAIFSIHRGDHNRAQALLEDAKRVAATITPTLQAHPSLRVSGSYVDAMEVCTVKLKIRVLVNSRGGSKGL